MKTLLVATGLLFSTTALAQQESCSGYTNALFAADVEAAKAAMATADLDTMSTKLYEAKDRLKCLDELVDRTMYADFARHMALTRWAGTTFEERADELSLWKWWRSDMRTIFRRRTA